LLTLQHIPVLPAPSELRPSQHQYSSLRFLIAPDPAVSSH